MKTHWLGAGMSSGPGLGFLARSPHIGSLTLWNRTTDRALRLAEDQGLSPTSVRAWDAHSFSEAISAGDIVVSNLSANLHPMVARICLDRGAHLFTSSYVSPELRRMSGEATARGLYFFNELGLDPGLDHFFAHVLVERFLKTTARETASPNEVRIDFFSGCGGFPRNPGGFRYKFSWSPLGVLRALKNSARWIEGGETREAARPYRDVSARAFFGESFESYPNRDSVPFAEEYGLSSFLNGSSFQRATLRPLGWQRAWREVFGRIEEGDEEGLCLLARDLEERHAYSPGDFDRVVLRVQLKAVSRKKTIFDESFTLDATGSEKSSAMAVSVSGTTAIFAERFAQGKLQGRIQPGVHGFPKSCVDFKEELLEKLSALGIEAKHSDGVPNP